MASEVYEMTLTTPEICEALAEYASRRLGAYGRFDTQWTAAIDRDSCEILAVTIRMTRAVD